MKIKTSNALHLAEIADALSKVLPKPEPKKEKKKKKEEPKPTLSWLHWLNPFRKRDPEEKKESLQASACKSLHYYRTVVNRLWLAFQKEPDELVDLMMIMLAFSCSTTIQNVLRKSHILLYQQITT